jgi:hypothetical protein
MADHKLSLPWLTPQTEVLTTERSSRRAVLYTRVSTSDQHPETQLYDLREMAKQRGLENVREYSDVISGAKSKRLGLDRLMSDARRQRRPLGVELGAGIHEIQILTSKWSFFSP